MKWLPLLEKEQITIRVDKSSNNIMLEVNSGGASPKYVTLYLEESEVKELANTFESIINNCFEKE